MTVSSTSAPARSAEEGRLGTLGNFANTPTLFLVLVALLYMHGWGYLRGYYGAFGITLAALELTIEDRIGYAVRSLYYHLFPWRMLMVVMAAVAVGLAWRYVRSKYGPTPVMRTVARSILVILLVPLAFYLAASGESQGREDARREMLESESVLPRVQLEINPPLKLPGAGEEAGGLQAYRVAAQTKYYIYVFRPWTRSDGVEIPAAIQTLAIPLSRVSALQFETQPIMRAR
jgi:hypothetical protein